MKNTIELAASDLNPQGGIFCPNKRAGMTLWDSHPRVFLAVGKQGEVKCPYCSTIFKLKAGGFFAAH